MGPTKSKALPQAFVNGQTKLDNMKQLSITFLDQVDGVESAGGLRFHSISRPEAVG